MQHPVDSAPPGEVLRRFLTALGLIGSLVTRQPSCEHLCECSGRHTGGDVAQLRLVLRCCEPSDRSNLAVRQATGRERFVGHRQLCQGVPDTQPLTGGAHLDVERGCDPMCACRGTVECPLPGLVEGSRKTYELVLAGREALTGFDHLGAQRRQDFGFQRGHLRLPTFSFRRSTFKAGQTSFARPSVNEG